MIESVQAVAYGRAATNALGAVIGRAKAQDPLAPVTVIVASNLAGLAARRVLGASAGLANVTFLTPFALAQRLGGVRAAAEGRTPLTEAILVAAIRVELRAQPGFFAPVAFHAATESALASRYAELSRARAETLARLGRFGSARTRALVELFGRVRTRLTDFADEDTLARDALETVVEAGTATTGTTTVQSLGTVVVHLPQPLAPALSDLLAALTRAIPAHAIVGLTGDDEADAAVRAQATRLGIEGPPRSEQLQPVATATRILTASDVDEEVRAVLREVIAAAESGTAFERMAMLMPAVEPYARTVHAQLESAGIAYNGPGVLRLADTVAGRTLGRLVRMVDAQFAREELVAFLASVPLRSADGRAVPVDRWDRISRRAGIVGGDEWERRLEEYATEMADRADTRAVYGTEGVEGPRQAAADARALAEFVSSLRSRLGALETTTTWSARAELAGAVLDELVGGEPGRAEWPVSEQDAHLQVVEALSRLGDLDRVEPAASFGAFARAVDAELAAAAGRIGRFGRGVLVASIGMAVGLDLDEVFVLGLAEGVCPAPRREDALLSDADRARAVDGELPLRGQALGEQRREFLAALSAGARHRVLSFPRGDLRTGRDRLPSRWLLESATVLAGRRVFASDFSTLSADASVDVTPSFAAALVGADAAASADEHDLGVVGNFVAAGGDALDHPLVASSTLSLGIDAMRGRASPAVTRWDGAVANVRDQIPTPGSGDVVSATRLETWAHCPFRYLMAHVLGVAVEDAPERVLELSPLDRGTLVHEVLEAFVREEIDRPVAQRSPAGAPWPESAAPRLIELLDIAAADTEARGLTGKATLWTLHREEIEADLMQFLVEDNLRRVGTGAVPEWVEMAFGFDDAAPVRIETPSGRAIRFRGRLDRVDQLPDGSRLVIDYKTGTARSRVGDGADPVHAGTRLQLPLYAEAARQGSGADHVEAAYWYVTQRGGFSLDQIDVDAPTAARFAEAVDHIAGGIDAGLFPAVPGEADWYYGTGANCAHCKYDSVCTVDRVAQWETKAESTAFEAFDALFLEDPDRE